MVWKRIPPALLFGLAIRAVFDVVRLVHYLRPTFETRSSWDSLEAGITVATSVLVISGALQLVKLRGHRIEIWIVIGAELGQLALAVAYAAFNFWLQTHEPSGGLGKAFEYFVFADAAITTASAIGFGLISGSRALAIVLPAIAVIGVPIPPLADAMWGGRGLGFTTTVLIRLAPYVVLALGSLAATNVAARTLASPTDEPAERPFEQAARALWLRVIAAVSLAGVTLLAMSAGAGFASLFKLVTIMGPLVDAIALAAFARAALGLSRANVSRWLGLAAATGALWCAGVMLSRIPIAYEFAYPSARTGGFIGMFDSDDAVRLATAYAITVPLVAAISIGLVLIAITGLARRRNLDDVRENASVRTGAFVVLALGSLFIAHYGLAQIAFGMTNGMLLLAVVAAAGASIYALVIAAKLCEQARAIVSSDPTGLPAATLIKDSSK